MVAAAARPESGASHLGQSLKTLSRPGTESMARSSSSTAPPKTSRCRSTGMFHAARTAHMSEPTCVWMNRDGAAGRPEHVHVHVCRMAEAGRGSPRLQAALRSLWCWRGVLEAE